MEGIKWGLTRHFGEKMASDSMYSCVKSTAQYIEHFSKQLMKICYQTYNKKRLRGERCENRFHKMGRQTPQSDPQSQKIILA